MRRDGSRCAVVPAAARATVTAESWWFKLRELAHAQRGVSRCGSPMVSEIWCDLLLDDARRRVEQRHRHPVHQDAQTIARNWADWSQRAESLGIGCTIRVDAAGVVPVDGLVEILQTPLAEPDVARRQLLEATSAFEISARWHRHGRPSSPPSGRASIRSQRGGPDNGTGRAFRPHRGICSAC